MTQEQFETLQKQLNDIVKRLGSLETYQFNTFRIAKAIAIKMGIIETESSPLDDLYRGVLGDPAQQQKQT